MVLTTVLREISLSLTLGVVSGLATSIAIWFFLVAWTKQIRPAWEELLYKGIDVSGKWSLIELDGQKEEQIGFAERIELFQSAHRLTGTDHVESEGESLTYATTGKIQDSFVSLQMSLSNRKRLGCAVLLCRVEGNGGRMSGYSAFYDSSRQALTQASVTYERLIEQTK